VNKEESLVPPGKIASVITSLEMFERPPLRPEQSSASWKLERIVHPAAQWYRDLFRRVGEAYLWLSRLRKSDAELREILDDERVEVYAFKAGGKDEGILELDFREPKTCELAFFGVTAPFIGSGAGRWLMNRAIEIAWSHPIERFWVHTCTLDHPGAVEFYRRSGFRPFRRELEIVDDPRVLGLLPRTAAPNVPIL